MSWREYSRAVSRASEAAEQLLAGPDLDQMGRFNRERRRLIQEMLSLQRQLEGHVEIPPLHPLHGACDNLDGLLGRLAQAQEAQVELLRHHLLKLDLEMLELKMKHTGGVYLGSPLEAAVQRLQAARAAVQKGGRLPQPEWQHLAEGLALLAREVQARQQQQGARLEADVQRLQARMFSARLEELRGTSRQ